MVYPSLFQLSGLGRTHPSFISHHHINHRHYLPYRRRIGNSQWISKPKFNATVFVGHATGGCLIQIRRRMPIGSNILSEQKVNIGKIPYPNFSRSRRAVQQKKAGIGCEAAAELRHGIYTYIPPRLLHAIDGRGGSCTCRAVTHES